MANMGAEVGATTSTFPYSSNMRSYLKATGRSAVAAAADDAASKGFLAADEGAEYDDIIEIVSVSFISHSVTKFDLPRIFPSSNRPLTAHLLRISLHRYRSSDNLSRRMAGRMNSLQPLLDLVQTALMKIWYEVSIPHISC